MNEMLDQSDKNYDLLEEEVVIFPTSFSQERLWLLDQITDHSAGYHSPLVLRIEGTLNISSLEKTLQELVNRHEILRTSFAVLEGHPVQVVWTSYKPPLAIIDAFSWSNIDVMSQVREAIIKPFNLKEYPPLRYTLLCLSSQAYVLIISMHHIITDGWSNHIFIQELSKLYQCYSQGKPFAQEDLPIQYGDFAEWQRQWLTDENLKHHLDYWQQKLVDASPLLELPTDRIRPPAPTFQGSTYQIELPSSLIQQIKQFSQSQGITLFTLFETALKILLYKWTGYSDLVIGTVVAGRTHSEIESLLGCFMNFLPLRSQIKGGQTLLDFLQQESQIVLEAYNHQECPFEKIVESLNPERNLNHNPIFNVALLVHNFPNYSFLDYDLNIEFLSFEHEYVVLDLKFEVYEKTNKLYLSCDYRTDLFDISTIQRLLTYFQETLQALVDVPEQKLQDLSIIPELEYQQILIEWNQTNKDYPLDQTLHQLIESQVLKTPHAIAIVFEERTLTYTQLNEKANQLAHYVQKLGVKPDTLVGICIERSLEMVIGLLGILKAGGAYVPFDPDYPQERLSYMLEDSQVEILLTQKFLQDKLPSNITHLICLDQNWPVIATEETANPNLSMTSEDLAYVIYTSGSTGKPKGAMNTHQGIVNRLLWMQETYQLNESDHILQKTPFSFDVSVWEFFWPLLTGATLVMAQPGGHKDSGYLVRLIQDQQITTLHFVPSMLQIFIEEPEVSNCGSLKRVICSGEALPFSLQERFFEHLSCELHNLYGPTEAAIDVTYWQCIPHHSLGKVPIGRPVANTQLYILDSHLKPVPIGAIGELHIGGVQVGKGYLNRPELTAEKFILSPFEPSKILYKTGDLCRYLTDGNIEYMGRIDHQVKIRGFRIELGEIESAINLYPDVRETVVIAHEDQQGNKRLVSYLVSSLIPDRLHFVKPCKIEVRGKVYAVQSEDISTGGLRISKIPLELSIHEMVRIQIQLPGQEFPLWFSGKVNWYRDKHAGIEWDLTNNNLEKVPKSYQWLQQDLGIIPTLQRSLSQALKEYLKNKLPEYMIPSAFVLLEKLPLTPNGKVDRRALPSPEVVQWEKDSEPIAPRNETEKKLAELWHDIFKVPVGVTDNFFEKGGNSLLATQVMSRLRRTYQIDLPLRTLFEHPTIESLANHIANLQWITDDSLEASTNQEDWETGEL